MASVGIKRIDELSEKITQLTMKTTAEEPLELFVELSAIARHEVNWNKVGNGVGLSVAGLVFAITAGRPDTWFHYSAIILAFILAVVVGAVVGALISRLVGAIIRNQLNDWARRADLLVRGNTDAAATSASDGTSAAPIKSKPRPIPISQTQKILAVGEGLLGLIFLGIGLYKQIGILLIIGSLAIIYSITQLFHRPDR